MGWFPFNQCGELIGRKQPLETLAMDEERGCPLDTAATTFLGVLLYHSGVPTAVEAGIEGRSLESQLSCESFQIVAREGTDIFAGLVGK